MKAIRLANLLVLGLALSFAAGCKTKPQNMRTIHGLPPEHPPEVETLPPIGPGTGTESENLSMTPLSDTPHHEGWNENADQFKANTVHFAFDSSVVASADKSKVAEIADYLKGNPMTAVRVEGNCDERGTEEYNRSLGERRALAVREELIRLGITPDRVDTISYGEDRPANPGHNESAWKENRRADFILLTPPGK